MKRQGILLTGLLISLTLAACGDTASEKATCGNGKIEAGEQCDLGDRNGKEGSACDATCKTTTGGSATCGNGVVDPQKGEECDLGDKNGKEGSTCDANCKKTLAPSTCGNGIVETDKGEQCDLGDQNGKAGSACDANCKTTTGGGGGGGGGGGNPSDCSTYGWFNGQVVADQAKRDQLNAGTKSKRVGGKPVATNYTFDAGLSKLGYVEDPKAAGSGWTKHGSVKNLYEKSYSTPIEITGAVVTSTESKPLRFFVADKNGGVYVRIDDASTIVPRTGDKISFKVTKAGLYGQSKPYVKQIAGLTDLKIDSSDNDVYVKNINETGATLDDLLVTVKAFGKLQDKATCGSDNVCYNLLTDKGNKKIPFRFNTKFHTYLKEAEGKCFAYTGVPSAVYKGNLQFSPYNYSAYHLQH